MKRLLLRFAGCAGGLSTMFALAVAGCGGGGSQGQPDAGNDASADGGGEDVQEVDALPATDGPADAGWTTASHPPFPTVVTAGGSRPAPTSARPSTPRRPS